MPDFTLLFPPEIITEITQQLNQKECIECMSVCQRWFDLIPTCTATRTWHQLHISNLPQYQRKNDSWRRPNNALLKCLGTHVKHVTIIFQDTWKVLQFLYDFQCDNIQYLDIHHHQQVTSTSSKKVIDKQHPQRRAVPCDLSINQFFLAIDKFTNSLIELHITSHPHDFSLMALLDMLPVLTHLSVKFNNACYDTLSLYDNCNENDNITLTRRRTHKINSTQLVYLCLDNALDFHIRICNILRRCPRLEFFLLVTYFNRVFPPDVSHDGIQTALTLCPSIKYIHWDTDLETSGLEKKWMDLSKQKNDLAADDKRNMNNTENNKEERELMAMREIAFSGESQEYLTLVLSRSQPTLEHLHFSYMDIETQFWYDIMHHYKFPHLLSLELMDVGMDDPEWPDYLYKQQQLERIKIKLFSEGVDCLDRIMTGLGRLNKRLLSLSLEDRYDYHHYNSCCTRLDQLCNATHIEQLELIGIPLSDQGVMCLSELPRLRHLTMDSKALGCREITKEGMVGFVRKLRQLSKIQLLHLAGYEAGVDDDLLGHLAQVESLIDLRITSNNNISDVGIDVFRRQSVGRKKRIQVNGHYFISYT